MSSKGKINQYTCATCGKSITTIDRDDGVTPMMLACRATPGCWGTSVSHMYHSSLQSLTPDHEWYRPDKLPKDRDMRQYVKQGGLLIRKLAQKEA